MTRPYLFYIVSIMGVDVLAMQGVQVSAAASRDIYSTELE